MSTLSAVHAHPLLMPLTRTFHPIDALRVMFHAAGWESRPGRIYYPPDLSSVLEDAAMAREMGRL